MNNDLIELSQLFQSALDLLAEKREDFNHLDTFNHNHGDHMLEIFSAAQRAASEKTSLPEAMAHAGDLLQQMQGNESAQVYGRGLRAMADQFQQRGINLEELAVYLRRHLGSAEAAAADPQAREDLHSGEILKALLNAMTAWEQAEAAAKPGPASKPGPVSKPGGLDLGYLLGVGMAYLQAKKGGGDKLDVLAETIVASSPLGKVPHRMETGRQVVRAILAGLKTP